MSSTTTAALPRRDRIRIRIVSTLMLTAAIVAAVLLARAGTTQPVHAAPAPTTQTTTLTVSTSNDSGSLGIGIGSTGGSSNR